MGCQDPGQGGGESYDPHLGGAVQDRAGIARWAALLEKLLILPPPCRPIGGPKTLEQSRVRFKSTPIIRSAPSTESLSSKTRHELFDE